MRKTLLTIGLGLALTGATFFPGSAAAAGLKQLHGNVPAALSGLQPLGLLPATSNLNLAIGLPLRNREVLTNLLREIYDPASPNYHHFLTPEAFTAKFGPTEQEYQAVIDFAKANGLTVTATHPNRMLVDVSSKPKNIEKALHVTFRMYRHPKEARNFFAPDVEPTVDAALPILSISGMNNYSIPHPNYHLQPGNQGSSVTPATGSGPGGAYQGNDFRNAYVSGSALNGAGQKVGLLQFDGFFASDIASYENLIGLTSNVPQLVVVPIDGGVPVPTPFGNPEVSLDIETVISMAPGVSTIYVYEAPNPSPWVDILSRMANDNLAKQLSCSWGGGPPDAVAEQIFQQMALQGQTFFNASGDSDAFNSAIEFPSDSPHITQVGGTFLTTGSGSSYGGETVWNRDVQIGPAWDGVGSSGGISTFYSIPSWQTNINMTASQGSTTMRNVPDVALTGENVWVIYGGGRSGAFGGTSCAAPLWAGFTALANQQAASLGHSPMGFINPALYAIARTPNYANCFHDITTGNNKWSGSPNLFSAVSGYDLCTGLGTPNGMNLINTLTAAGFGTNSFTHFSPPPPPYGSTLAAVNGGNANGTWELFVQDVAPIDSGMISNGWVLTLTAASPVVDSANLQLLMTTSSTNVPVNSVVTNFITLTNYGPSTSSNVLVTDSLPLNATLLSAVSPQGSVIDNGFNNLVWNVGTLANGVGAHLTLRFQMNNAGNVLNSATASSDTYEPNPNDNFAFVQTVVFVVPPPQLSASYVKANGTFILTVPNPPSAILQATTNLVSANWVNVFTNTLTSHYTDSISLYPNRFYRAVLGP